MGARQVTVWIKATVWRDLVNDSLRNKQDTKPSVEFRICPMPEITSRFLAQKNVGVVL